MTTHGKTFNEKKVDSLLKIYSAYKAEAIKCKNDKEKHVLYIKAHIALLEALHIAKKLKDKFNTEEKLKYIKNDCILKILSKYAYQEDIHKINQTTVEYFYLFLVHLLFILQNSKLSNNKCKTTLDRGFLHEFDNFKIASQSITHNTETILIKIYYIISNYTPYISSNSYGQSHPLPDQLLSGYERNIEMPYYFEKYFFWNL